jgi:hypothetical protein
MGFAWYPFSYFSIHCSQQKRKISVSFFMQCSSLLTLLPQILHVRSDISYTMPWKPVQL